jgi:hypothetical protein|tara:strand:+ start:1056 stop:1235 length:180 start_codon:yes stop_codon:yes gene_type:complete
MTDKKQVEELIDELWEHTFYTLSTLDTIILAKNMFKIKHLAKDINEVELLHTEIFGKDK